MAGSDARGELVEVHLGSEAGDIAVLQNMSLQKLTLYECKELTGKPTVRFVQISKVLPQGNT